MNYMLCHILDVLLESNQKKMLCQPQLRFLSASPEQIGALY